MARLFRSQLVVAAFSCVSAPHILVLVVDGHPRTPLSPLRCETSCANIFFIEQKTTFLHPEKSISEELRQGEEVFVVLTNKM